tara:strand:+ start:58241 stop:59908 length:1668 start_codon:yes stop_codon:yes gene_type:complete
MSIGKILTLLIVSIASQAAHAQSYDDYAMPINAKAPAGQLQGTLKLAVRDAKINTRVILDNIDLTTNEKSGWNSLPSFAFSFVQSGDAVIPTISGAVTNDHPNWEWVLAPGKIWAQGDISRLSIPFALMEKNENCLHNGVLRVIIEDKKIISKADFLIASETCSYVKFDMWGEMDARWQSHEIENAKNLIDNFQRAENTNIQVRDVADLSADYPEIELDNLSEKAHIREEDMTFYGILKDNVHYVSGCQTRVGQYPHCGQMLIPSYSFAKSIVAAFSLMSLEKLYPGTTELKISHYVPQCQGEAWDDVRFIDALNMTTGNYHSRDAVADEAAVGYRKLFTSMTHSEKIEFSCNYFPRQEKPGSSFVYHTSDTYILGAAMSALWKEHHQQESDFFNDLIVKSIFEPLGLSASTKWIRRSYDDEAQPFTGWGMLLNRNDLVKLMTFLGGYNEHLDPTKVFADEMFRTAMNAAQSTRPTANEIYGYANGFWAYNLKNKLGCAVDHYAPHMSGFGGLSAVILSARMGYYSISDGGTHAFLNALFELHKISPLCEGAVND